MHFVPVIAALVMSACASLNEEQCRNADWRAIGLRDGQSGQLVARLDDHRKSCGKYGIVPDDQLWLVAREQGLKQYCTPINGLRVGRSGYGYTGACPTETAAAFLSAYRVGQAVSTAQARVSRLESDIYAVQHQIARTAPGKERDMLLRRESELGGGRWNWGGDLYRARRDLSEAEWRADELARRLSEAAEAKTSDRGTKDGDK